MTTILFSIMMETLLIYLRIITKSLLFSPQTNQWLVGTVSGHPYAWLRCNKTSKLPPGKGWEYRHGLEWFNDTSMTLLPFRGEEQGSFRLMYSSFILKKFNPWK